MLRKWLEPPRAFLLVEHMCVCEPRRNALGPARGTDRFTCRRAWIPHVCTGMSTPQPHGVPWVFEMRDTHFYAASWLPVLS